jgi:type IV pilus assembly protein PilW
MRPSRTVERHPGSAASLQHLRHVASGFSLVELMIGIVISIICTLGIMSAFAAYEGQKRTTTSSNDAQQSGSFALYKLERQVRSAGSGIVQGKNWGVWGCGISGLAASALPATFSGYGLPATSLAIPVLISSGGTNNPDVIDIVSGNPTLQVFKVGVASAPDATSLTVSNGFGILANDYLLGTLADGSCKLGKVSSRSTNDITLVTATTLVTGLASAVKVFDMGSRPQFTLFGVDTTSNALIEYDQLQRAAEGGTTGLTVADGIVQMKALYGVSIGGAALVWVPPTGAWSIANLTANTAAAMTAASQIKAIRIAVVAQSRLPERGSDYKSGSTSLTLFRDLPTQQFVMATQTQFRYKVYDTTIPVRNALITTYF